jgi:hypothetical protein
MRFGKDTKDAEKTQWDQKKPLYPVYVAGIEACDDRYDKRKPAKWI